VVGHDLWEISFAIRTPLSCAPHRNLYGLGWIACYPLANGRAQVLLSQEARLSPDHRAVLDARAVRSDLSCHIEIIKPHLGFDLRLHTHYRVTGPNKMLDDSGGSLLPE
jgi:hypothetical protein